MTRILRHELDSDADALYIYLSDAPNSHGEDLSPERRVDFAADGSRVGVELTCISHGVHLANLPAAEDIGSL